MTPYHSQDILLVSGQLRWKIELIHACVIVQVGSAGRAALTDEYAEKSGRSYARERPLNVSNLEMGFKCCVPFNLVPHQSHGEESRICNILIAPFSLLSLQT